MYAQIMNRLFPLILGGILYYVQTLFFSIDPFSMYLISSIPAGWFMLNRYRRPLTDNDIIIREIRRQRLDGMFELLFFAIRKTTKLAIAFTIGWIMVPYLMFEIMSRIVSLKRFNITG